MEESVIEILKNKSARLQMIINWNVEGEDNLQENILDKEAVDRVIKLIKKGYEYR